MQIVELISKLRIGTIIRFSNNQRYIIKGRNKVRNKKMGNLLDVIISLYNEKTNDIMSTERFFDVSHGKYIIDKQLSSLEVAKYSLLGTKFYEELQFQDYLIKTNAIKETDQIVINGINKQVITREGNKLYRYDKIGDLAYIINKREIKDSPEYFIGYNNSGTKLKYVKSELKKDSTNRFNSDSYIKEFRRGILKGINEFLSMYKNETISVELLLLYREKKDILYKKITNYVILNASIVDVYCVYPPNYVLNGIGIALVDNTSNTYNIWIRKLKPIIDEVYNCIISNICIDARKKLSTVAKEVLARGKNISKYNTSIDIEEFFDTNKYYAWEIMDWLHYI